MSLLSRFKNRFFASTNVASPVPGYVSAGTSKRSLFNWIPPLRSAKTEISSSQNKTLVARAYDAYRNQDIARAAVTQVKTNAVGCGLKVNPNIDAEYLELTEEQEDELESAIEREFDLFTNTCDAERTLDLEGLQLLNLATFLISGDSFANTFSYDYPGDIYSLKIQIVDGERVSNPDRAIDTKTLVRGVEINELGAPIAYKVLKAHPSDTFTDPEGTMKWDTVPAFDQLGRRRFLHTFDKERPGQVRGVSFLAPILERLKQVDRYSDSELMAAVVSSYLTFFIESNTAESTVPGFTPVVADPRDPAQKDSFELGPGAAIQLSAGKKVTSVNPSRPNQNFEQFFFAMCRSIGASLGLPVEEVLLLFNSSYSASRAAMLKAWKLYGHKRSTLIKMFLEPIYALWFDEAVHRGALPHITDYWNNPRRRLAYQRHDWLSSGRGAIDELAEAQAAGERIKNGLSSIPLEVANLTGTNYKNVLRQQDKALRMMRKFNMTWPLDAASKFPNNATINKTPTQSQLELINEDKPPKTDE